MEQIYNSKMQKFGYDQLVCDIFGNWEDVKDELLIPERKTGSGNGTIHVFLGAADAELHKEFAAYYTSVERGSDPALNAVEITHYFMLSNVISMLGHVCQYNYVHRNGIEEDVTEILEYLNLSNTNDGLLETTSLFKLSTGSSKLRPYFKQFESNGVFAKMIRKILLPNSAYKIALYKNNNNQYAAFWLIGFENLTDFEADSNSKHIKVAISPECSTLQKIFYGAPGTGKSHEVKRITGECENETRDNVFRTTFHPDTDYATFAGCYKPTMRDTGQVRIVGGKTEKVEEISYEFVPQTFTDAYVYAYKNPDTPTYLVIEEINRGNCAQIFGDLFQLLDRKRDGTSEYSIKADTDLAKHLIKEGVASGDPKDVKLCLPANLHILATMNTSDQSLFPMDSAFKRRWDWEYVPISYTEEKSSAFEIEIGGEKYSWVKFIEAANKRIFDLTQSEDKQMGNFFVKSSVDERQFKSKVMFYLWNEVLRDEVENQKYFFYATDEDGMKRKFTFKDLYEENATETLKGFMRYLDVEA